MILGGSGLVGSHLLACLRERGHQALGTCWRQEPRGLQRLSMRNLSGISEKLKREKFDALAICSGFTWVDECERKPKKAKLYNAILPGKIAGICRKHRTKVVYLSTSYVFDGKGGPYAENCRPNPLSVYGRTKLEGELRVSRFGGKDVLIVRTMGVMGAEAKKKNFLYTVIHHLQKKKILPVSGDQRGNITWASDLAMGICLLLEKGKKGVFHIAGQRPNARRTEVAKAIAHHYQLDARLIRPETSHECRSRAPRPQHGGLITEKAKKQIGWKASNRWPTRRALLLGKNR